MLKYLPNMYPNLSFYLSVPTVMVDGISVSTDSVTPTTALLTWSHVSEDPDVVHGFFRGYRIQYGLSKNWPAILSEQVRILSEMKWY